MTRFGEFWTPVRRKRRKARKPVASRSIARLSNSQQPKSRKEGASTALARAGGRSREVVALRYPRLAQLLCSDRQHRWSADSFRAKVNARCLRPKPDAAILPVRICAGARGSLAPYRDCGRVSGQPPPPYTDLTPLSERELVTTSGSSPESSLATFSDKLWGKRPDFRETLSAVLHRFRHLRKTAPLPESLDKTP